MAQASTKVCFKSPKVQSTFGDSRPRGPGPPLRLGLISDLHGNLPALEAVLAELEQEPPDEIVCLGDIAVGPHPAETLARVRELDLRVVQGNWDSWFADGIPELAGDHGRKLVDQSRWWAARLSAEDLAYLGSLPATLELPFGGGLLCFHGSPRSHSDAILPETSEEELAPLLDGETAAILAGGHTHLQLARPYKRSLFVNPGSVGLPFESWPPSGARVLPWAEYAVLESQNGELSVDLRRVEYDVGDLLRTTLASGVPHARWWVDCWAVQE
jgi:predicted phosphodiesterase